MMHHHYLMLKPWHPANKWNQKRIYEAEQQHKEKLKREAEARAELDKNMALAEQSDWAAAASGQRTIASGREALRFMYAAPPGLKEEQRQFGFELDNEDGGEEVNEFLAKFHAGEQTQPTHDTEIPQSNIDKDDVQEVQPSATDTYDVGKAQTKDELSGNESSSHRRKHSKHSKKHSERHKHKKHKHKHHKHKRHRHSEKDACSVSNSESDTSHEHHHKRRRKRHRSPHKHRTHHSRDRSPTKELSDQSNVKDVTKSFEQDTFDSYSTAIPTAFSTGVGIAGNIQERTHYQSRDTKRSNTNDQKGSENKADATTTSQRRAKGEETRSELEKSIGASFRKAITTQDIYERFPELKNAPVERGDKQSANLSFRPMGKAIRNVRCLRCNQWGHQTGDRECPMRHINPKDVERLQREDPMSYFQQEDNTHASLDVTASNALGISTSGDYIHSDDEEFAAAMASANGRDVHEAVKHAQQKRKQRLENQRQEKLYGNKKKKNEMDETIHEDDIDFDYIDRERQRERHNNRRISSSRHRYSPSSVDKHFDNPHRRSSYRHVDQNLNDDSSRHKRQFETSRNSNDNRSYHRHRVSDDEESDASDYHSRKYRRRSNDDRQRRNMSSHRPHRDRDFHRTEKTEDHGPFSKHSPSGRSPRRSSKGPHRDNHTRSDRNRSVEPSRRRRDMFGRDIPPKRS